MARKIVATTIISKGAEIYGRLELDCAIHIDGKVKGEIKSHSHILISNSGVLKGDIKCDKLIVSGEVEGKIEANFVEITKKGFIKGEIITNELVIEEGGIFEGKSTIKSANGSKKL